jgi:O-antigen/teichoic acid export membrane protein
MNFSRLLYQSLFWRGCNFFSAFLLNLFMARYFEAGLMGQVSFFIAVLSFVILAGSLNFEASLVYFSADDKQPLHHLISLAITWIVIYSLGSWFLSYWLAEEYMKGFDAKLYGQFAFFYLVGFILINYYNALFFGKKDFTTPNLVSTVFNVFLTVLVIVLYANGGIQYLVKYYLPVHLIIFIIQGGVLLSLFHWKYVHRVQFKWPGRNSLKIILRYTGYMLLTNFMIFLLYRADYWLLRYLNKSPGQLHELGNYIQVSKIGHMFLVLSATTGGVVFSTSASGLARIENLARLMRGLLYIGLISFLLIVLAGPFLFTALYGESFNYMYPCLVIVMPGIIALMLASVTANFLSGTGNPQYNLRGVLLGLIIMLVGDYFLIPHWGIYGAAAMSSAGYIAYSFYLLLCFANETGFSRQLLFSGGKSDWKYFQNIFNGIVSKK